MTIVSSTDFRKNIAKYVRESQNNKTPIIVTTQKQGSVVVIPMEEWEALQETFYLMASPRNKDRLDKAVKDVKNKKYTSRHITSE